MQYTPIHELKTDPEVFEAVIDGSLTHNIRLNDRGFAVGDLLHLRETAWTGQQMKEGSELRYTGRVTLREISHILTGYGLAEGWCTLSFRIFNVDRPVRRFTSVAGFSSNTAYVEYNRGDCMIVRTDGKNIKGDIGLERAEQYVREGTWRELSLVEVPRG